MRSSQTIRCTGPISLVTLQLLQTQSVHIDYDCNPLKLQNQTKLLCDFNQLPIGFYCWHFPNQSHLVKPYRYLHPTFLNSPNRVVEPTPPPKILVEPTGRTSSTPPRTPINDKRPNGVSGGTTVSLTPFGITPWDKPCFVVVRFCWLVEHWKGVCPNLGRVVPGALQRWPN